MEYLASWKASPVKILNTRDTALEADAIKHLEISTREQVPNSRFKVYQCRQLINCHLTTDLLPIFHIPKVSPLGHRSRACFLSPSSVLLCMRSLIEQSRVAEPSVATGSLSGTLHAYTHHYRHAIRQMTSQPIPVPMLRVCSEHEMKLPVAPSGNPALSLAVDVLT